MCLRNPPLAAKRASYLEEKVKEAGGDCQLLPFDVADEESVKSALDPILKTAAPKS